jgi:hypothetical protein
VALSAIEKLADFSPLLQEHLPALLGTAFSVGIYSNLDVAAFIADTIANINAQKGY